MAINNELLYRKRQSSRTKNNKSIRNKNKYRSLIKKKNSSKNIRTPNKNINNKTKNTRTINKNKNSDNRNEVMKEKQQKITEHKTGTRTTKVEPSIKTKAAARAASQKEEK
ncbi:hypothetical protein CHS0354_030784 [Potamilus streckersoni]|uniref:Uncharacterized protein n=1 Tax=Potamilus streckersoni TaxID=2493646 RepID=A0AAE0TDD0_9BIVA|nr:hypothetical protein CHS0354_030784 [Potamilus streckersoni]